MQINAIVIVIVAETLHQIWGNRRKLCLPVNDERISDKHSEFLGFYDKDNLYLTATHLKTICQRYHLGGHKKIANALTEIGIAQKSRLNNQYVENLGVYAIGINRLMNFVSPAE